MPRNGDLPIRWSMSVMVSLRVRASGKSCTAMSVSAMMSPALTACFSTGTSVISSKCPEAGEALMTSSPDKASTLALQWPDTLSNIRPRNSRVSGLL